MRLVTRRHLQEAKAKYPEAAKDLDGWATVVPSRKWFSFSDVRKDFPSADAVAGYVVFNVRHNRYRLITVLHYCKTIGERTTTGVTYIRSFLTHKEYDNRANWDKERRR